MSGGGGAGGGNMGRGGGPDAGSMDAGAFGGDPDRENTDFSGLSNAIAQNVLGVVDGQAVTDATPANLAAAASQINQALASNQGQAIPEEENTLFGINLYDKIAPVLTSALDTMAKKGLLGAWLDSPLAQKIGLKTATDLATGANVITSVYGMGQALKGILEDAGFTVTEEGPSKKGEIPGQETDTTGSMLDFMDLNFQGMEGVNVDPIGNAVLDLNQAFASNYDNPAAYNQSVIDALGKVSSNTAAISKAGGDPTLAVIQREIAQKAAEKLIAQEAARNNNIVNIPVAEGPAVNVKITKAPKRPKRGKEAANYIDPGPSPAQIAAASVVADQAKFKTLPKRIQKQLRSGQEPTGSDYDVDRALALLKPPAPPIPRAGTRAFIEGGYGGGK